MNRHREDHIIRSLCDMEEKEDDVILRDTLMELPDGSDMEIGPMVQHLMDDQSESLMARIQKMVVEFATHQDLYRMGNRLEKGIRSRDRIISDLVEKLDQVTARLDELEDEMQESKPVIDLDTSYSDVDSFFGEVDDGA